MENEIIVKPLPPKSVIAMRGTSQLFEALIGKNDYSVNYAVSNDTAYLVDTDTENSVLLYTSRKNKELRRQVAQAAEEHDFKVYFIDQLNAITMLPAAIAVIDPSHLSELELRHIQQLVKEGNVPSSFFIFPNYLPDWFQLTKPPLLLAGPVNREYLTELFDDVRVYQVLVEPIRRHYTNVVTTAIKKSPFTGQEFVDALKSLHAQEYLSALDSFAQGILSRSTGKVSCEDKAAMEGILTQWLIAEFFNYWWVALCDNPELQIFKSIADHRLTTWTKAHEQV